MDVHAAPKKPPVVRLEGVTRSYDTGKVSVKALRGIDLEVEEGEFLAIMGPSGSGKSTLMNLLGCLDRPTSGAFYLNGVNVARLSAPELARIRNRTLGFVFQAFHLLPRTSAQENVELPLLYHEDGLSWKEIHRRAREALDSVGLGDRLDHTPNELSGGQKQRVAIARALVTEPRVLLADEPTGNLDSRTTLEVVDILQRLNAQGLTILMVTHEPEIARFARRIVTLRDGLMASDRPSPGLSATKALAEWRDELEVGQEEPPEIHPDPDPEAAGIPASGDPGSDPALKKLPPRTGHDAPAASYRP
jgi:putative ABC transport system ATP-binding protein